MSVHSNQKTIPELFSHILSSRPCRQVLSPTSSQQADEHDSDIDLSSDEENLFQNAICRKRILRQSDHCPQDMQDTCHASSKSSGTRFRKRVASKRKASWDVAMCDSELFDQYVNFVDESPRDSSSLKNDVQGALVCEILSCKSIVDRMRGVPNETLQPDVWSMAMMNENGYEPRDLGQFILRQCSMGNACMSRYITAKNCDCCCNGYKPILAECMNADAVKKLILGSTHELKSNFQQFGQHRCILCRAQCALAISMDIIKQGIISMVDYLQLFAYDFIDVHDDYMMECNLTLKETGVQLIYKCLNVPSILNTLTWIHSEHSNEHDIIHRIDFSHLTRPRNQH